MRKKKYSPEVLDGTAKRPPSQKPVDWRDITNDKEKYHAYLCSPNWAWRREAVRERCGDVCERCHKAPMSHVHHRTYIRKYHEELTDLEGLCEACHSANHCKTVAPVPTAPVKVVDNSRAIDEAWRTGDRDRAKELLIQQVEQMQQREKHRQAETLGQILAGK